MSDGDFAHTPGSIGVETDRWVGDFSPPDDWDDEYEAFALDYVTLEAHVNDR